MPYKYKSKEVVPEPNNDSQEKQKSSIRWAKFKIQLIINWFCTQNEKGNRVNYDIQTTGNHSNTINKMLIQTRLAVKAGVIKKKALDKLVAMIKQYKDLRHTIEQFGWDIELDGLDGISYKDYNLQTRLCKTAKKFILQYCTSCYKYKKLFYNYPKVNPPAFIELEP